MAQTKDGLILNFSNNKYYFQGIWLGNFYKDSMGNICDTETNSVIA